MTVRLPLAAMAAGLIAGMARTPAQHLKTIPLIMQAEAFVPGLLLSRTAGERPA